MCMEDIRLGRKLGTAEKLISVSEAATTVVAPPDPKRTRLAFSGDGVETFFLSTVAGTAGSGHGITLTPSVPLQVVRIEEYGALLRQSWHCQTKAAAAALWVADSTLENE